ncbi:dual specificity protein phosphatase family protein [Streptomyces sp. ISL-99]|uniref:protein-tyrosine phosphatase family protein n=1 Tax=Streptomyces sp. ISL-99 TaxID=2819193 RepID=UPI001BEC4564|nr:dual specificity protein phosphatase [Streptomyces sp. ISL-99]MBT2527450.1 dual specificity protein phosphatase family protein [Streptomyces sp. ISL-99]
MGAELCLDAHAVTNWLLLGAAPDSTRAVDELLERGVTHVLDCRTPRQAPLPAAIRPGLVWCSAPTEDDGASRGTDWYAACVTFAERAAREENARLYVHCAAGVNRSPAAAYTILRSRGWAASAARARILTSRAEARPRYFEDAEQCLAELGLAEQERP